MGELSMNYIELFAPIITIARRLMIRHQLANIEYQRAYIQNRRANDFQAERFLDKREVMLRSELRSL
jgi:hypothetical protein